MMKNVLRTIVVLLVAMIAVSTVPVAATDAAENQKEEYINIDVQETKLSEVLSIIARKTGVNVLIGKGADITISINMKDVYFEKAFEIIGKTYNRPFRKIGNTYIFETTGDIYAGFDRALHKTFRLQFAQAGRIKTILENVFSGHKNFKVDSSRPINTVIVTGTQDVIDSVHRLIKTMDVPVHRIRIEAELIKMKGESGQTAEKAELIAYSDGVVQSGLPLTLDQTNIIPTGPVTEDGQQSFRTGFRLSLMPSANDDGWITLANVSGRFSLLELSEELDLVPELKRVFDTHTYCKSGAAIEIGRFYDFQSQATFIVRITPTLVQD